MENNNCPYCDPKSYVVYGPCGACGKEIHPRLENFEIDENKKFEIMIKQLRQCQKEYKEKKG